MARREVHTVHNAKAGAWSNVVGGRAVSSHLTKREAVADGRDRARAARAEHVIHRLDGTIGEKNSYGNDRRDRKG